MFSFLYFLNSSETFLLRKKRETTVKNSYCASTGDHCDCSCSCLRFLITRTVIFSLCFHRGLLLPLPTEVYRIFLCVDAPVEHDDSEVTMPEQSRELDGWIV
jgi:hypothetical protein